MKKQFSNKELNTMETALIRNINYWGDGVCRSSRDEENRISHLRDSEELLEKVRKM